MSKKRKTYISSDDEDEYIDSPHSKGAPSNNASDVNEFVKSHVKKIHSLDRATAISIQSKLTAWFLDGVHEKRGMPWRKPWDPTLSPTERAQRAYEVWVSEIMLQQTRVDTVIPFYNRWIETFPTVRSLAESNIEAVNALWKGLGYYSRAARLFEGSKVVVQKFNGRLPDDIAVLQADVPGIGRYSSGAICSIAYGKCVPVLDGNVHRLMSRLLALYASPKSKSTLDILWDGAEAIVKDSSNPGAINQALIELGSTVCTPQDPKCGGCPLRKDCGAYQWKNGKPPAATFDIEEVCNICEPLPDKLSSVTIFPMKVEKKKVPEETDVVCVIGWKPKGQDTSQYLLRKRPKHGLLAGLWDFPVTPNVSPPKGSNESISGHYETIARELVEKAIPTIAEDKNVVLKRAALLGSVLHVFSHVKKTFQVVHVELESPEDGSLTDPPTVVVGDWMNDLQKVEEDDDEGEEGDSKPKPKKRRTIGKGGKGGKNGKSGKGGGDSDDGGEAEAARLKWVLEANVAQENLGTGTMKVWALVQNPNLGANTKSKSKSSSGGKVAQGDKPKARKRRKGADVDDADGDANADANNGKSAKPSTDIRGYFMSRQTKNVT